MKIINKQSRTKTRKEEEKIKGRYKVLKKAVKRQNFLISWYSSNCSRRVVLASAKIS
jgi:hypothetical protein